MKNKENTLRVGNPIIRYKFTANLTELENCETNLPAIVDFKGRSYFIYHNGALKTGDSYRRSVCIDYLYYNPDGTMKRAVMTSEGSGL